MWYAAGQKWQLCQYGIMCSPANRKDSKPVGYPTKDVYSKLMDDPSPAYPENSFRYVCKCESNFVDCVVGKGLIISTIDHSYIKNDGINVDIRHCFFREKLVLDFVKKNGFDLGVYRESIPIAKLTEESTVLYLLFERMSTPEDFKFKVDNEVIIPSGWRDKEKCYVEYRKEDTMANTNFGITDEEITNALDSVKKEEVKTEKSESKNKKEDVEMAKEEGPTKEEILKSFSKIEEGSVPENIVVSAPSDSKVESEKTEKEDEVQAEVKEKKTRKRAPKAEMMDLTEVIESVNKEVPNEMSIDNAIKEIRQLRDLLCAGSRRIANLSTKYLSKAEKLDQVVAQMKELL